MQLSFMFDRSGVQNFIIISYYTFFHRIHVMLFFDRFYATDDLIRTLLRLFLTRFQSSRLQLVVVQVLGIIGLDRPHLRLRMEQDISRMSFR